MEREKPSSLIMEEGKARLIKIGAEAALFKFEWNGFSMVAKKRIPKSYRHPALDFKIRSARTSHEAKLMHAAKTLGVPCPSIFLLDKSESTLYMEHINGRQLKAIIPEASTDLLRNIGEKVGRYVGSMHGGGIVHGDLTTSNIIVNDKGQTFFVDFGLGDFSTEVEERSIDIHLMRRALESSHYSASDYFLSGFEKGYTEVVGRRISSEVFQRMEEILSRGRYVKIGKRRSSRTHPKVPPRKPSEGLGAM